MFVHEDSEFIALLTQVSAKTGIATALVEKDYWITHSLWALHETKLAIWFKGGTSLSKGFGIIERFSEDLDLMIERGGVATLPEVANWTSTNKGPIALRHAFYEGLPAAFAIPGVSVRFDAQRRDKYARAADLIGRYPGAYVTGLPPAMSPFLRFRGWPCARCTFCSDAVDVLRARPPCAARDGRSICRQPAASGALRPPRRHAH